MSSFRIRPRFKHQIAGQKEGLENLIKEKLKTQKQFKSTHLPGHIYIKIHPSQQHFWSPQLHLTFEQDDENVIIRGLYGPNPTVWAVFFFGYIILSLLACFIAVWGFSLWSLDKSVEILWGLPVLSFIAAAMYLAGQFGQKMAAQQMFDIHHFYESIAHDKVIID
ncbi:hypothetical protein [Fulvivirga lutimaris]|uniref:hypothetical protein n=1 Tax=Fulvivirga lutimaris TaxID=1819566 RepID=UPI0012BBC9DE|nr:hypothetical protein [Fulvivirga lutimaris]MTI38527.1 hypothetical protein [Fulvivirga lutimaris]